MQSGPMMFIGLLALVGGVALWRTVALVRLDGLGHRPPPRSHAAETVGTTWPQHEQGRES